MSVEGLMLASEGAARRRASVGVALVLLVVLLALISLGTGPVRLSPLAVIDALVGGGSDVHALPFGLNALALLVAGLLLGAAGSGLTMRRFLQV